MGPDEGQKNDLRKLPFRQAFGFCIGFVEPLDGQRHVAKQQLGRGGWQALNYQTTIRPVLVQSAVTNATIYGSKTGEITLTASNGNTGSYTYQWDDQVGLGAAQRTNLVGPRTYGCLVSDQSGASTYVSVAVGSDPRR